MVEGRQSLLRSRLIQRRERRVPGLHAVLCSDPIALPVRIRYRGQEALSEWRHARRRHHVDGRIEDHVRHTRGLRGNLGAEQEQLREQAVGMPPRELLADVLGERGGGPDREVVAHARKPIGSRLPVAHEMALAVRRRTMGRAGPIQMLRTGRLHLGTQDRVGKHPNAVPAADQGPGDAHQGRHRASAIPRGYQELCHSVPPGA
jgi:hypothetical protein